MYRIYLTVFYLHYFYITFCLTSIFFFFFFNDTATTEIYTLSLHDALPISPGRSSKSSVIRSLCLSTQNGLIRVVSLRPGRNSERCGMLELKLRLTPCRIMI